MTSSLEPNMNQRSESKSFVLTDDLYCYLKNVAFYSHPRNLLYGAILKIRPF